jgi:NAD(P)-dependent dehydrogenase (short-subunit alcohol dehydrogenase family)
MASENGAVRGLLEGRVAWVVGASGAIGSAIAATLAAQGAVVVASGRNRETLDTLVSSIMGAGGRASVRVLDICDGASVTRAVDGIIKAHGAVDGLVNSTSLSIFGDFEQLSDAQWLQVLDAKLLGYVRTMRAVLPHMAGRGSGSIVNISGRGGRQPTAAHLPGGAANAAVNLVTKGISDIYFKRGVRANVVAPGPIVSARFEKIRASNDELAGGERPRAALDHMGAPEDVADAVAWLLSDLSRHTTGAVIPVDGGGVATV